MENHNLSIKEYLSEYTPSYSLPNQRNDYSKKQISLRSQVINPSSSRNQVNKQNINISNISTLNNSKIRSEHSYSPMCILNNKNKESSPEMMNIRMNFDLLNHKIERLNTLLNEEKNTSINYYDSFYKRPSSMNKLYDKGNYKFNSNINTTTPSYDSYSNNSPLRNSYSLRYNNINNNNVDILNESNDLRNKSINNFSNNYSPKHFSRDNISINLINNYLNPPQNNNIDNFTYQNKNFINNKNTMSDVNNNNNNITINNNYPIKVNIKTIKEKKIERPLNEFQKQNGRLLTESDITEMINNLHEKTKKLGTNQNDGLDRYRRLKLNQRMNNFNKRMIGGNWKNSRNNLNYALNSPSHYIRNFSNNKGVSIKYTQIHSPIKGIDLNFKNDNNRIIKVNKIEFCNSCKKCKKNPEKNYCQSDMNFDKKMNNFLKRQNYNNIPIQERENNNNLYQKNFNEINYNKRILNVKDLTNEYEKKNENKNALNSLNIDKPIDNFGGLENFENRNNQYEQNKNFDFTFNNQRKNEELDKETKKGY